MLFFAFRSNLKMNFFQKSTVILASFIIGLFWSYSVQAEEKSEKVGNPNITNEEPTENNNETEPANSTKDFGDLVCLEISAQLEDKINFSFLNAKKETHDSNLPENLAELPKYFSEFKELKENEPSKFNKLVNTAKDLDRTKTFKLSLHYLREGSGIIKALQKISELQNFDTTNQNENKTIQENEKQESNNNKCLLYVTNYSEDTLIFYGEGRFIDNVHRIIAVMDLPRPGINLEIYGIQISSNDPNDMAKAMIEVRKEINKTQLLIHETYTAIQQLARTVKVDDEYRKILEEDLGYKFALDVNRPLTWTDILILLSATNDKDIAVDLANTMSNKFQEKRFKDYTKALKKLDLCPFEGFFRSRGLRLASDNQDELNSKKEDCLWEKDDGVNTRANSLAIRSGILDFALQYADSIQRPNRFNPYLLQQTSDILNTSLRATINIINRDIENMFMQPTLENIREIVSDFNDVTYAQVGKTTVAGLSGLPSTVTGEVESNFDITPPLRMLELLEKASANREQFRKLLPSLLSPFQISSGGTTTTPNKDSAINNRNLLQAVENATNTSTPSSEDTSNDSKPVTEGNNNAENSQDGTSTSGNTLLEPIIGSLEPTIGPLPLTSLLGLLSVYEEDRSVRQKLGFSGPQLNLTPYVLRNMASAELKFELEVGNPLENQTEATDENGKPLVNLSRITKHTVDTTVYVDAVDLFTISTFSTQSSIDGGRGYIPIIGTVWRGVFSDIPVFGNLFSWKKDPQTVYHESLLLTNSYITPTVMGLALQYSNNSSYSSCLDKRQPGELIYQSDFAAKENSSLYKYNCRLEIVEKYKKNNR